MTRETQRTARRSREKQEDGKRIRLTQEEIVEKATELFARDGFGATSLDDIAIALGVTQAALYYHIKNKEEILRSIYLTVLQVSEEPLQSIVASSLSAREKLRQAIEHHVKVAADRSPAMTVFYREWSHLTGPFAHEIKQRQKAYERYFEEIIQNGIKEGLFAPTVDARIATFALLGMCNWLSNWYHAGGQYSPQQIADMFAFIFENGLDIRESIDVLKTMEKERKKSLAMKLDELLSTKGYKNSEEEILIMIQQDQPQDEPVGNIETIAQFNGAMPTGVTVSHQGRIFVCYPKWGDEVPFTVAEIKDGQAMAYPNQDLNNDGDIFNTLISVQSVVVDPRDRLWILDTGSPEFKPTTFGGPKLVGVDLQNNTVFKKIFFPRDVVLPTSYLNDVRFDLRRGKEGMAFITDSADKGPNGIIVVDLASGESWRKLNDHPSTKAENQSNFLPMVEGQPFLERPANGSPKAVTMGADGIALSADGKRLYYCPLVSRQLYSVPTDILANRASSESDVAKAVVNEGNKGGGADGMECD
nr:TetR family transcriptional regulator [Ktedonobacteraceae bacterium]